MQIWQLFIIIRHPVIISVTVFTNLTKLTNDLFIFPSENYFDTRNTLALQAFTLAGPTVTRPVQEPLAVLSLENPLSIMGNF